MLKKKKDSSEEQPVDAGQNNAHDTIAEEIEQVNQSRQNHKNDTQDFEVSEELEKLKAENVEANNKYLRLYAEFDNYKRRTSKERVDLLQTAGKDVVVSLLPVLDDFERALKSLDKTDDTSSIREGIYLIYQKLKNTLQQKGLKEMQAIGETFDADLHEAITNIPAPSEDLKGKVIDEAEKGYYLNDKVIRFAKVIVGA
ncbi:nucleotide exchange factor GrpE [Pedobacter sp. HMF7647]|uniref:Protein GrpE n=2 Tax=Hufsiella arboris TaxID=2695275 RepID=A0A7K1YEV6_9SPHI|nr:nucleotide exchange factor GrpE [Hufsiella arboris]